MADVAAVQGSNIGAAATMLTPGVGGEEPVVGQECWEQIHRLKAEEMTVSGIARVVGLDRKTVRRCVRQVRWQAYRRSVKRGSLLAPAKGVARRARPAGWVLGTDSLSGVMRPAWV